MTDSSQTAFPVSLLIVEDCSITLKCYTSVLTMLSPEVTVYTASNGTEGLDLFKAHRPDIVITDLNMPEMDGRQMATNIRAIRPDTRLVVLTGDKERLALTGSGGDELPFDHVIEKPVDFKEFFAAIKQCIDEIAQQGR